MTIHQPVMVHHHVPRWLEYVGVAMIVAALVLGLVLVADRIGWTTRTAAPVSHALIVPGTNGGGIAYTGVPYPVSEPWVVRGTSGGGVAYTGVPSTPVRLWAVHGTNGGGIVFTGVPSAQAEPWVIRGPGGGGIVYTGVPYTPPTR